MKIDTVWMDVGEHLSCLGISIRNDKEAKLNLPKDQLK